MNENITSLRPNVAREEALRALRPGLAARLSFGPLRCLADVYVPFHLYRVEISSGGKTRVRHLAFDAAFGILDPYEFQQVPEGDELTCRNTRNALPIRQGRESGARLLAEAVRRQVYQEGFWRLRGLQIRVLPTSLTLHVPYWVGFYGWGDRARIRVLDALRRAPEGAKLRDALTRWLLAPEAESKDPLKASRKGTSATWRRSGPACA